MWSIARSEASLEAELGLPITIVPMRRARRMRLRFDEARGHLKLTCPWRTSRKTALSWALEQREWIEAQRERVGDAVPLVPGAIIPIEGVDRRIEWDETLARRPRCEGPALICGGPRAGLERRIAAFLKDHALATMSADVADYAARAGVTATGVRVGDATSRWGSCSSDGRIRLSWRLILAPPEVRRYVVAHEVAHLRHHNHGPVFKALERELVGDGLAQAKAALRILGPGLRRIGGRAR